MPVISEEEKCRRQESADSVFGTNALSGIELDDATHKIFQRYVCGDLTLEQFSSAMDAHAEELAATYRAPQPEATTPNWLP